VPALIGLSRDVHAPEASSPLRTPLWMAVLSGSDLAVAALLARGADAMAQAWDGESLVELAHHQRKYNKAKNLRGQIDRIIAMLATGHTLPAWAPAD
jgi:hypothetical protein